MQLRQWRVKSFGFWRVKKMAFNKGEWSELAVALKFLIDRNLHLVDESLNDVSNSYYGQIDAVTFIGQDKLTFLILDEFVTVQFNNQTVSKVTIKDVEKVYDELINGINKNRSKDGAFDIPIVSRWLTVISGSKIFKSPANEKADLSITLLDKQEDKKVDLTYSIKSSLGSPSTILNASSQTKFKYRVYGLTDQQVNEVNSINTRSKLIDRFNYLDDKDIVFTFESSVSDELSYNLSQIDPELEKTLSEALILSYRYKKNKDLFNLFLQCLNNNEQKAYQLLSGLLDAISFGFVPGTKWDGKLKVDGGLIIMTKDKGAIVLDKKYNNNKLLDYMVHNSKFDSPSSKRYNMLDIYSDSNGHYFTLNLHIRYKK
jgi:hypothetical protein